LGRSDEVLHKIAGCRDKGQRAVARRRDGKAIPRDLREDDLQEFNR
jgi:hypothetical protein